jgi:hypothetical protein
MTTWIISSEKDPRWNGQGISEEQVDFVPPEALQHFKQCQEKLGEPPTFLRLKVKEGNAYSFHFLTSSFIKKLETLIAEQRPVPPVEEVPNLSLAELWLVLKHDAYRQGKTYYAVISRLEEIARNLPTLGDFKEGVPMTREEQEACQEYVKAGGRGIGYLCTGICQTCKERLIGVLDENITPDGKWRYSINWKHQIEVHNCRPFKEEFIQDALTWFRKKTSIKFQHLMTRRTNTSEILVPIDWTKCQMEEKDG